MFSNFWAMPVAFCGIVSLLREGMGKGAFPDKSCFWSYTR